MNISSILNEFNESNSLNHKREVCKKYKDNKLFLDVFRKTYDNVLWTYGVTMKKIPVYTNTGVIKIEQALVEIEKLSRREITGNDAIIFLHKLLSDLSEEDSKVLEKIINRDLRINFGKKEYNKIVSKEYQCSSPVYMRCDVFTKKSFKNISFPAIIEKKADGTFREFTVEDGEVTVISRSGESYEYPVIAEQLSKLPDGKYIGELTVRGTSNRAESNGLINSLEPPHQDIILECWDYVTLDEYYNASIKVQNKTKYIDRFNRLKEIIKESDNIKIIDHKIVNNIQEAIEYTSELMNKGFEGTILKDMSNVFRDGTAKDMLKLKIAFSIEVRITGFQEGTPGTKRENTFGSILYTSDDGFIKGRVSGFTDKQLEDFNSRRSELIGKIIEIEGNDLTKADGNDYYAVSHPRFIEIRNDRDDTDTLEKAIKALDSAKSLEWILK